MGAEGLPVYGVVCIVGGPAPSHIIGGADDKLKRKPSLDLSSVRPVVHSPSLSLILSLSHARARALPRVVLFADKPA